MIQKRIGSIIVRAVFSTDLPIVVLCLILLVPALTCKVHAASRIDDRSFAEFAEHFDRVRRNAGLSPFNPAELSAEKRTEILAMADRAVAGFHMFYNNEYIAVGLVNIDWTGGQRNHQEWIAMLNRFYRYLPALTAAYQITGDEKYPARARLLMEEFRRFVAETNQKKFFDPQKNNLLNISIRMQNWSEAIRGMGSSPEFSDEWVAEILRFMNWQLDCLDQATQPGMSNFQIFQSDALTMTSLYFANLPGAAKRLRHGAETMRKCLEMQFRPDGTHGENTHGYHLEMLDIAVRYNDLHRVYPEIPPGLPDGIVAGGLDFAYLSYPWGFNDHRLRAEFPGYAAPTEPFLSRAEKAGLKNWRPPVAKAFPDGGLFFAGNADEHLLFDAAKALSGHSHLARLQVLYAAYGEILIADCGITTYDRNSPYHIAGQHSANHATASPDGMTQARLDAKSDFQRIADDFAVLEGHFDAGYLRWTSGRYPKGAPEFAATHRRSVIWLAGRYLLLFDRIDGGEGAWNFTFPVPGQEKLEIGGDAFFTVNRERPNLLVKMIRRSGQRFSTRILCGETGEIYRGWRGILTGGVPMPLLQFTLDGITPTEPAVTLIAATPPGRPVGEYEVTGSSGHHVEFTTPDGGTDCWLFRPAGPGEGALNTRCRIGGRDCEVRFNGEHLLLRRDASGKLTGLFADRAAELVIDGRDRLAGMDKPFTGMLTL